MKRWISTLAFSLCLSLAAASAKADFNLVNIDLASPDARRAESLYGQAYGFQPVQVAPVMSAPAEEVPAIMQLAQAAGTLPISVWMLRQTGMNYGQIMQQFAVAPLVGMGQPVTDVYYIERARHNFLVDRLRVDPILLPSIPLRGPAFTRFIVYPVHPKIGYWMPPGQAKKYGLWIPPGQAKKMGLWDGKWGHDRWRGWDWDDHDWDDDHDHWKGGKKGYDYKGSKAQKDWDGGPQGGKSKGHGGGNSGNGKGSHGKGKHGK